MNVILISTVGYIQILKHFYIRILINPSDSIKKHGLNCCFKTAATKYFVPETS